MQLVREMSTARKGQTGRRGLTNYLFLSRFVAFRHFFRIKEQRFLCRRT